MDVAKVQYVKINKKHIKKKMLHSWGVGERENQVKEYYYY